MTAAASAVESETVNNRTSKEDLCTYVGQVSSQHFWSELILVYELHLLCDVAQAQRYTTLLGAQCTIRSGPHTCLIVWRSWVRFTPENLLRCHIYITFSFFISGIFPVNAGVYFHRRTYRINETFLRSMLGTGIYCNWDTVVKYFRGT